MRQIVLFFTLVASSTIALASQAPITIANPAGGELFVEGQVQYVRLSDKTRAKSVLIEISRDGGVTFSELGTIDNTTKDLTKRNVLKFTVTAPDSSNCILRATGGDASVVTGAFSITGGGSSGGPQIPGTATPSGAAGGDLAGTYPNPTVGLKTITFGKINSGPASANFLLAADGSGGASWIAPPTGSGGTLPTTQYYSVNFSEFVADYSPVMLAAYNQGFAAPYNTGQSTQTRYLLAAVHLPDGASITNFTASLAATSGGGECVGSLLAGGTTLATVTTTGGGAGTFSAAASHTVNNQTNTYYIRVACPSNGTTNSGGIGSAVITFKH